MLTQNFFKTIIVNSCQFVNFGNILFWVKECVNALAPKNKIGVYYDRCQ